MPIPITLKVFRGNVLVRTEQFSREIIKIGRLATAHLVLDDEKISRIHAVVEVTPEGGISIIDMGTAEGTFVNGKKVSRSPLKLGDEITVGGVRIVVEGAAEARAPSAPAPNASPARETKPTLGPPVPRSTARAKRPSRPVLTLRPGPGSAHPSCRPSPS